MTHGYTEGNHDPHPVDPPNARINWMRHATAPLVLRKVASALAVEGIPILPVKGVVTARILYDDVAARPLPDIDLRVRRGDFAAVVRIARTRGWAPKTEGPVLWTATLLVDGWEIDIEATIGPPGLCALPVEDFLRHARHGFDPFGFAHVQPELNDHALILILNAFKDGLRTMPWALEDLRRIARHKLFDTDALVTRAREGGVASALWIVADWLSERHGSVEWRGVRERIGPRPPSRRVERTYAFVERRGWRPKPGLLVAASCSDNGCRSALGLALVAAGIARRKAIVAKKRRDGDDVLSIHR